MEQPIISDNIIDENLEEEFVIIPKKSKPVKKIKSKLSGNNEKLQSDDNILNDMYNETTLIERFTNFKNMYISDNELIKNGLKIRHQNTPEDITENITKFIIRKYENDKSCVWCKGVDKKYGLTGDLYSNKYEKIAPIEVKSFTSSGPSQFGPDKKFGVLYFLDLRKWLDNEIVLW